LTAVIASNLSVFAGLDRVWDYLSGKISAKRTGIGIHSTESITFPLRTWVQRDSVGNGSRFSSGAPGRGSQATNNP